MTYTAERTQQMWNATRAVCAIAASSFLLGAGILILKGQSPVLSISVALVCAVLWLALRKAKPSDGIVIPVAIFLAVNAVGQSIMWSSNDDIVRHEKVFEIYTGYRVTALVIGLIAPPLRWLGWLIIIVTGAAPTLHYYLWGPELRARVGVQEPWLTLIYVVVSGILYSFRSAQLRSERRSASLQERLQMLQRFAHIVINTQHQVNTPLQTIENSVGAIRQKQPELSPTLNLIDRSTERIQNVMKLFSLADSNMSWKEEVAPVSPQEFEQLIHDLNNDEL